ncbi:talin rod domain-containing protein 1-like [Saccoglossus kowalevskii]|uniref:Mesoderm development candidate 1-like n=1 Tax=Saccoglossus kowalevskii TaxID=10224 RepID=A0ABM0GWS8_SACKO|nr:PREDICTED: mesoderm development candidate 1-like [Saccoglossus kowalevskii]
MAVSANDTVLSLAVCCDVCASKMQAVVDLLLLTSDLRPVNTESLSVFGESYAKCRDTIIARTKGLSVLTRDILQQMSSGRYNDVQLSLREICELVVSLTECSAHAAYLAATTEMSSIKSIPGIVDKYKVSRAKFDIENCCNRIQHTPITELSPQLIVEISDEIRKNLHILSQACMLASDTSEDPFHKEQFKLCVKSMTACAMALFSTVKRYKNTLDERNRLRCVVFSRPLVQACQSLVDYATESEHLGSPAKLSEEGKNVQTAVLGGCMSVVSPCVQLCLCVQSLAQDPNNTDHQRRIISCSSAIADGSTLLSQALRLKSSPRTSYAGPS